MTPVATPAASLPSSFIKMEDRKRSAGQSADDLAPPTKRQAINGGSKASIDADMPWKDDLEVSVTRSFYTLAAPIPFASIYSLVYGIPILPTAAALCDPYGWC